MRCACAPSGRTRITLVRSGEVYTLVPPNAMVHNIVIGRTWVDAYGPMTINCTTTGAKCRLEFKACGWFGYGRHEFEGYVMDSGGAGAGQHARCGGMRPVQGACHDGSL